MSAEMQARRAHLLNLLHEYRSAGRFPKNYEREGRKPRFIDRDGTICAVGYLIEQTAGWATAGLVEHRTEHLGPGSEQ